MFAIYQLRFWHLAVASACLAGLSGPNATFGQPAPAAAAGAANASGVLAELAAIKNVLKQANHDYKGHRANAMREIQHAMREIESHRAKGKHAATPQQKAAAAGARQAKAANVGAAKAGAKQAAPVNPVHEAQAASDQQLRTALQMLTQLGTKVGTTHPKLQEHLQRAIQELKTALSLI